MATEIDTPIYIDLQKERIGGTEPKEPTDLLQRDVVENVLRYLLESTSKNRSRPKIESDEISPGALRSHHEHDTIMVDGERGGGKTTSVLNILKILEDTDNLQNALQRLNISHETRELPNFYSLGIFDPTLLEDKQNIVILIINRIRKAVEASKHCCKGKVGSDPSSENVDAKLYDLARGLSHLSGVGGETIFGEKWLDPDFILDEGLEHAEAGDSLVDKVSAYIETAAAFLCADAFVLAVDDIDTAFNRGWPMLEAIRKYLLTPKLKIIMSGDLELYRVLVRQHQFDMLSQNMLKFEQEKATGKYTHMGTPSALAGIERKINELEDQYITKLLPPDNRHRLRNLYQLIFVDGIDIRFPYPEAQRTRRRPTRARLVVQRYTRKVFKIRQRDTQMKYIRGILSEPVRSSLRILAGGFDLIQAAGYGTPSQRAQACEALRQTALSALSNSGVEPTRLVIDAPRDMIANYIAWFSYASDWRTLPRLYPEYQDNARNIAACAGAASLIEAFRRDPSGIFEYLVKIAATRELHDSRRVPTGQLDAFIDHVMLMNQEPSYNTAARMAAWLRSTSDRPQLLNYRTPYALPVALGRPKDFNPVFVNLFGVRYAPPPKTKKNLQDDYARMNFEEMRNSDDYGIGFWTPERLAGVPKPLRPFHQSLVERNVRYTTRKGGRIILQGRLYNSLESLNEYIKDSTASTAVSIPFFKIVNNQGFEFGTFSVLRFQAFLESMITLFDEVAEDAEDLEEMVEENLNTLTIFRSYPVPDRHSIGLSDDGDEDEGDETPVDEILSHPRKSKNDSTESESGSEDGSPGLAEAVTAWLKYHAENKDLEKIAAAPITLSRISTRFHYAANEIGDELRHLETRYLGLAIHRYLIGLLHAFAVELSHADARRVKKRSETNPRTRSEPFRQILEDFYPHLSPNISIDEVSESRDDNEAEPLFDFIFSCPIWGFYILHEDDAEAVSGDDNKEKLSDTDVFKIYRTRLQEVLGWSPEKVNELFQCRYQPDGTENEVVFNNLLIPLNTVPIQGQTPRRRPTSGLFTDALAK